jgi:hypothetical protein
MEFWKKIFVFAFWGVVIMACSTVSAPEVAAIPTATNIKTATATLEFTKTPKPTITVSPTIETTPTISPEKLAEIATLDAIVTEKPELVYDRLCVARISCFVSTLGLSPNGKWAAFYSVEKGTGELNIVNVASKKQWDISYYDITGNLYGDTAVEIEHWSHDGYYLYVSPRHPGDGGMERFWRAYTQLIRMNLENGTWVDTQMGSSFSFSPNDKFIAYRRGTRLVVYEFQTGNEQMFNVPAEYRAFGRFVWSPDSKQILFVGSSLEEFFVSEEQPNGFTLFLLDVEDMKAQTILEKDERYLYPLDWQTSNIVLLESLYKVRQDGSLESSSEKYQLDLETNKIQILEWFMFTEK